MRRPRNRPQGQLVDAIPFLTGWHLLVLRSFGGGRGGCIILVYVKPFPLLFILCTFVSVYGDVGNVLDLFEALDGMMVV